MIGSLDDLDEVEEGALDRLREMEKARQRQFGSRSEAGRYAAEMRWKNKQNELLFTPTDDPQVAKETGRPISWLLDGSLPEGVDEALEVLSAPGTRAVDKLPAQNLIEGEFVKRGFTEYEASVARSALVDRRKNQDWINTQGNNVGDMLVESDGKVKRGSFNDVADDYAKALVTGDNVRVTVSVPSDALGKIIEDGRLKSQFEAKTSKGSFNPDYRKVAETRMFGLHPNVADDKRPIYGSVMPDGVKGTQTWFTAGYGDVHLVMKRPTGGKTTFTDADSLNPGTTPSRITNPNRGSVTSQMFRSPVAGAPSSSPAFPDKLPSRASNHNTYIEAQIHGGVKLSDVSYAVMDARDRAFANTQKVLAQAGIKLVPLSEDKNNAVQEVGDMAKGLAQLIATRFDRFNLFHTHTQTGPATDVRMGYIEDETTGQIWPVTVDGALARGYWDIVDETPFTKSVVGLILEQVTGIAKARQRQFSSRSEAGRYAAEMRWRNRQVKDENTMESLKQDVANLQAAIGAVSWGDCEAAEEAILDGKHIVRTPADWDANPDAYLVAMRTGTQAETTVGPKAVALEEQATKVGVKALAIADARLAERGITPQSVYEQRKALKTQLDEVSRERMRLYNDPMAATPYGRYNMANKVRRGEMTQEDMDKKIAEFDAKNKALKKQERDINKRLKSEELSYDRQQSAEARKIIGEVRGVGTKPDFADEQIQDMEKQYVKAVDAISQVYPASHVEKMNGKPSRIKVANGGDGGSYAPLEDTIYIDVSKRNAKAFGDNYDRVIGSIAVHEYGHFTASRVAGVSVAEQAFFQRRTRGGVATGKEDRKDVMFRTREPMLSAVGSNMVFRPDEFVDIYSGRDYSPVVKAYAARNNGRSFTQTVHFAPTEVFTSGVEGIAALAGAKSRVDPDHKAFALGILLGLP